MSESSILEVGTGVVAEDGQPDWDAAKKGPREGATMGSCGVGPAFIETSPDRWSGRNGIAPLKGFSPSGPGIEAASEVVSTIADISCLCLKWHHLRVNGDVEPLH